MVFDAPCAIRHWKMGVSRFSPGPAAVGALLLCFFSSRVAAASPRHLFLQYKREEGLEQCPSREQLASDVAAHLGYDPFVGTAIDELRVELQKDAEGRPLARIELRTSADAVLGRQTLQSLDTDCRELAETLALAVSLAIDPLAGAAPPAPAATIPPLHPPEPEATPISFAAQAGVLGSLGAAPELSFGVSVGAELRRGGWSWGVEGAGSFGASEKVMAGSVGASSLNGALLPCARPGSFGGCAVIAAGALYGSADNLGQAHNTTTPLLSLGARAFYDISLSSHIALRPTLEVDFPLVRTTLLVAQQPVWTTSTVCGSLGLNLVIRTR